MTEKLFDIDGTIMEFDARVVACNPLDTRFSVLLDRTAFAPEGGGQRSDVGRLGDAEVIDVQLVDGEIRHITDRPLAVGETVRGALDATRRIRHIQNHTGEHIVSGLFYKLYGYHNVGFHLGSEEITMDLDGEVSEEMLRLVEKEANRVVLEDRVVSVSYPAAEELASLAYRAKLALDADVRIVTVEGVDACACCAPHVARTGQIGMIKLLFAMRYKGGTRIYIKCGFDALDEFNAEYARATAISNCISLPRERIAEGVEKLRADLAEASYKIVGLKRELISCRAESVVPTDGTILFFEKDFEANELQVLVTATAEKAGKCVAAFSLGEDGQYRFAAVYHGEDFGTWRTALCDALCARGGGKAPFMQGKAACDEAAVRAFFS